MALNTPYTQLQLRAMVRTELLDPNTKFWPDAELNDYIEKWQTFLQNEFEFIWGTATSTVPAGTSTLTLSAVATDILRLDAMYWNGVRLSARSKEELDMTQRDWRNSGSNTPRVAYQDDYYSVSLWPTPDVQGTLVLEYPKIVTFSSTDTTTMSLPAWVKYSAKNFCVEHALLRHGPNQDRDRALRRRKKFAKQILRFKTIKDNFFPDKYLSIRPGGSYESDILNIQKPTIFR